jgi:hypothetical protein
MIPAAPRIRSRSKRGRSRRSTKTTRCRRRLGETFVALVADELGAFGATDDHLALAAAAVVEFDGGADLDNASGELLDPAIEHHDAMRTALDLDDPADELEAAGLSRDQIDGELQRFDEPTPPDIPEPDPGRVPRTDDDGTPPNIPPEA